ncbi:MAG: choice-of-anchor J domain-containing protein, partial [bacterium]
MINPASARATLLEEGFDAETFPPDGWQVINTHPENNWMLGNPSANPFTDIDPESVYSAICPWIAEDQDEWLISPEITPSGETPLNLNFYFGISGPWLTGATAKVHISTDGGTTWTELWDAIDVVDPEASWAWVMYTLNLDEYADAPFHIAWQYVGNDGDLAALDAVEIKEGYDYVFQTDFEEYEVGEFVAESDETGFWTTWDNMPGSETDAPIVDDQASSPTKSGEVAGSTDLVFKMGDKKTGKYQLDFSLYVPSTNEGYYNIQHYEEPGVEWAYDVFFSTAEGDDNAWIIGCGDTIWFSYMHDTWHQFSNVFDLNSDMVELWVDGTMIADWPFSCQSGSEDGTLQLGGADFWAGGPGDGDPLYYVDDVGFIELVPALQEPIMVVTGDNPIFTAMGQWEETTETFSLANEGEADLMWDIVVTYPEGNKAPLAKPVADQKYNKVNPIEFTLDPTPNTASDNPSDREVVLNYDGDNWNAIGNPNNDFQYVVAALFPADLIDPYINYDIDRVDVFINDPPLETKLQIYGLGNYPGEPGELLYEQDFTAIGGEWNTIELDEPFRLDGQDIAVGYWVSGLAGTFVPGIDEGPVNPNGDWWSFDMGESWSHAAGAGLPYNWNIRAYADGWSIPHWLTVNPQSGTNPAGAEIDVEVNINTANLEPQPYQGMLHVRGNDFENPIEVIDVFVDVSVGLNENGVN